MHHYGTHPIETERLILRQFRMTDTDPMYKNWASDPEVTKYLMWPPHSDVSVTASVLATWVKNYEKPEYYQWAITVKENGSDPIGSIAVVEYEETVAKMHIGYCIGRAWWHRGIMTEALGGVMEYLFTVVGANRLEARHDPRNPNSGAVMRKCGMQYEGTLRQSDRNNQGICDAAYYSILRSEWEQRRK